MLLQSAFDANGGFTINAASSARGHRAKNKAHGRFRRLSKQRFQRAFMPQRGRLRLMGVPWITKPSCHSGKLCASK
jgi:hypothetical protein